MKRPLTRFLSQALYVGLSALLCLPTHAADPEGMPDLSDPEQLLDAYIRTVGDTSGKEVLLYASVVVIGMHPGERVRSCLALRYWARAASCQLRMAIKDCTARWGSIPTCKPAKCSRAGITRGRASR